MFDDFKKFVMRGNVMDLAVGVIIGGAFGKIVDSLVGDLIMPVVGLVLGKVDFANLFVSLNGTTYATLADAKKAAAPVLAYGSFINVVVNFLILAFVIFILVKQVNKMMPEAPPAPPAPPAPAMKDCPECTSSIPAKAKRCPQCTAAIA